MGLLETTISGRQRRNNHTHVVSEIGSAIVAGKIPAGSLLPNDADLSAKFNVSRTVLRESMKTLAAKRLIEPKAKVGTRVLPQSSWNFFDADVLGWRCEAGVDNEFITHLADIRLALEPAAAIAAAKNASPKDILELQNIAKKFNDIAHTPESIAKVDLEFHLAVAKISGNPFMRAASALIEAALAISFKLSSPAASPETLEDIASNHLKIVDAIAAKDAVAAGEAMRYVIEVGRDRIQGREQQA